VSPEFGSWTFATLARLLAITKPGENLRRDVHQRLGERQ
jgi:hypothetical protein